MFLTFSFYDLMIECLFDFSMAMEILAARAELDCFYLSDKISEELSLTEFSFNYENSLVKD